MSQPYVGEIRLFGFDFAPAGWAVCDGSLVAINQNDVLFNVIGTTYGGDGQTTFALPNLSGRGPVHSGQTTSGSSYVLGAAGGFETVTLDSADAGTHTHLPAVQSAAATSSTPLDNVWAATAADQYGIGATGSMDPATVAPAGGGQPHENLSPYLTMNYCISLFGVFPSEN